MSLTNSIGVFLLKCVSFSIVFFAVSHLQYRPADSGRPDGRSAEQNKAQTEAYNNQVRQVAEQLARAAAQQQQSARILAAQEDQNARFEAVLQKWEKQTGLRK